jgi:hypothetical protein
MLLKLRSSEMIKSLLQGEIRLKLLTKLLVNPSNSVYLSGLEKESGSLFLVINLTNLSWEKCVTYKYYNGYAFERI